MCDVNKWYFKTFCMIEAGLMMHYQFQSLFESLLDYKRMAFMITKYFHTIMCATVFAKTGYLPR